ncbi:MAG: winged helix-turn-helix transcriptional regulator [Oscillospiraceae bacterium]|nr:winged helix-turn-helix transcriptional regulator [Oscillospiraceae bacterium]
MTKPMGNPDASEQYRMLFGRLAKLHFLRRIYIRQVEHTAPLNGTQVHLLDDILKHPGCKQIDVAERLHITPAAVAMTIKPLKQLGYLTAAVCPDNQRCKQLELTEAGKAVLQSCCDVIDRFDASVFDGFSEAELRQLTDYLRRMTEQMERALGREPMDVTPLALKTLAEEIAQENAVCTALVHHSDEQKGGI